MEEGDIDGVCSTHGMDDTCVHHPGMLKGEHSIWPAHPSRPPT
jgi:hypothetical protein